jgi:hypothetical protein
MSDMKTIGPEEEHPIQEEDAHDEPEADNRLPFFARRTQKLPRVKSGLRGGLTQIKEFT